MPKAIAIVSGGLDSVTLAYLLHAEGYELHLLSFDYEQRHKKELAFEFAGVPDPTELPHVARISE